MSTTSKLYTFHELMTDGLVTKHSLLRAAPEGAFSKYTDLYL